MKKTEFIFPYDIDNAICKELEKKIYYISDEIVEYKIIKENGRNIGVLLFAEDECNELENIRKKIEEIFNSEIIELIDFKSKKVWENIHGKAFGDEIIEELLNKKIICVNGEGQVGFREPLVFLFHFFGDLFGCISKKIFNANEYIFPTLLRNDVLEKVGYFESFPNLLMFTTRLINNVKNYDEFKNEFVKTHNDERIDKKIMPYCTGSGYGLPPTMCYYVYDMIKNSDVDNTCYTAVGKSFRYENKYYKTFERLWDFTIRETVFVGDRSYVNMNVNTYMNIAIKIMEKLELKGYCATANDPFFLTDNTAKRIKVQKMFGSKYEIRLVVNKDENIAIGSFNLHGQFLAKRFNINSHESKNGRAYTGCIGIGLERILYAFLAQKGLEEKKWPMIVQDVMNEKMNIKQVVALWEEEWNATMV